MFPIRDNQNSNKFPLVNITLIGVNIYMFIQQIFVPNPEFFTLNYALIPINVNFWQPETLRPFVTSMFLHAGFLHILSNMWFLWIFGDNVEAKIGHIKYILFYLFCGIGASFIQYLFIFDSHLPMVGASGAIAGVLGAYFKFFPKNKVDTIIPIFGFPFILVLPANFILIYWFITQAFNGVATILTATASVGGIAYLAHVGGFASGIIVSKYFIWPSKKISGIV
ncbi:hypothetical protein A3A48_01920 [Candidatus Curtissbacteria bacterium RIFCSPLOWO2_01_FULL_37_9]|uniref:Peptidase S54 rhomboid domain-containing protein n=1 Tax=Candidatus Curtissbacteria bacterium RIFCSPLOWO2_01_FULL_37_9 TaxID=1797724 RepID=A0A1F5GU02_9BACT|nr:MAG: hypothetical protein A3A48_01920 [Candidatus Curtissbacteria bacterium RIFCSPLOWO2_01_FULL_37_9]